MEQTASSRQHAVDRKPKTLFKAVFVKRFALEAVCALVLGAALGACSAAPDSRWEKARGVIVVAFDKNNEDFGSTEASPQIKTIVPPATTLDSLPVPPRRAGYRFVEWNTAHDGSGETFTEQTSPRESVLIVYARWKPALEVDIVPNTKALTPLKQGAYNEFSSSFSVRVSGFQSEAHAQATWLGVAPLPGVFIQSIGYTAAERTQTAVVSISYDGSTAFPEGFAALRLYLLNVPQDYALEEPLIALVAIRDGRTPNTPIPLDADNLEHFRVYANTPEGLERHYQLTENVTLPSTPNNWTAIGTPAAPFTGSFDGQNHTISNLQIDTYSDDQGFFGRIRGKGAKIKNLGLKGGSVQGRNYVGGVAGRNEEGTVQNCSFTGNVSGGADAYAGGVVGWNSGMVQNSYATGSVYTHSSVGGVVGKNEGTVQNCHATGGVGRAGGLYAGGVVGWNSGMVQNSYATGGVYTHSSVGGVVGWNEGGTVQNSYATGNVSGSGSDIGGVVGRNARGTVRNCYATGNVSGRDNSIGGVVGSGGTVQNCYATGSVSGGWYVGGIAGLAGVQNSVALVPSVKQRMNDGLSVTRIAYSTALTNNHARLMEVRHGVQEDGSGGTEKSPLVSGSSSADGQTVQAGTGAGQYNNPLFWTETMGWNFAEDGEWAWGADKLPILRDVGAVLGP